METKTFLDEMGTKASMIVMSNLSDVQTSIQFVDFETSQKEAKLCSMRLDFAKWLILKLNGNLEQYINTQLAWEQYCEFRKIEF